jgi:hypothetical protein
LLRGFSAIKLPNGLVINDVVLGGETNGRRWALLASKPMVDGNGEPLRDPTGKPRYSPVVEWGSRELQQEFSRRVVAIVETWYPDVFDAGSPP